MRVALAVICSWIVGASAIGRVPDEIPSPLEYPSDCGRTRRSSICDMDKVLSSNDKDMLEGHVNRVHSQLTGDLGEAKGVEIGVCLITEMSRHYISGAGGVEKAGEYFATSLHNKWGVGNAGHNGGVLVFLSLNDRTVFISRGSGLKNRLTQSILDQVITHMKPNLRHGEYGKALQGAVVEIGLILNDQPLPHTSASNLPQGEEEVGFFAVCLIFAIVLAVIAAYRNIKGEDADVNELERGRNRLESLTREVSTANSSASDGTAGPTPHFPSTSCPICLDDFPVPVVVQSNISDGLSNLQQSTGTVSPPMTGDARRAMELRCGHQFCFTCLEHHLKGPQGTKCPICRSPVDPSDPAPTLVHGRGRTTPRGRNRSNPDTNHGGDSASCSGTADISSSHQLEIRYRLQRMRTLYPQVMTADAYQSIDAAVGGRLVSSVLGQLNDRASAVNLIISNRRIQAQTARSGREGSTISRSRSRIGGSGGGFGGGSSSGGSGGRW